MDDFTPCCGQPPEVTEHKPYEHDGIAEGGYYMRCTVCGRSLGGPRLIYRKRGAMREAWNAMETWVAE